MKFANLVLQSPIIRSRHDLLPAAGCDQAALRHQPTPGEQLVWGNAMPTSHQAYRHTRLEGLFDHANLLRGRPAPTALNRRDDLNAIRRIGHRHGCMPNTCQVGGRVRSVRRLSQRWPGYVRLVPQAAICAAANGCVMRSPRRHGREASAGLRGRRRLRALEAATYRRGWSRRGRLPVERALAVANPKWGV